MIDITKKENIYFLLGNYCPFPVEIESKRVVDEFTFYYLKSDNSKNNSARQLSRVANDYCFAIYDKKTKTIGKSILNSTYDNRPIDYESNPAKLFSLNKTCRKIYTLNNTCYAFQQGAKKYISAYDYGFPKNYSDLYYLYRSNIFNKDHDYNVRLKAALTKDRKAWMKARAKFKKENNLKDLKDYVPEENDAIRTSELIHVLPALKELKDALDALVDSGIDYKKSQVKDFTSVYTKLQKKKTFFLLRKYGQE